MTKRASLTTKERREMLEEQGGKCLQCFCDIGPQESGIVIPSIAEHWTPVALGNDQKPDCLLCIPCANLKTNGTKATSYGSDKHAIAQAKRRKRKHEAHQEKMGDILRDQLDRVRVAPLKRSIPSKGFDKSLRRKFNGTVEARR